jgi:hypothetical protein
MRKVLQRFNLGDTYEIQARVLPSMLVVLPFSILVSQIAWAQRNWLSMIGWGVGLEVVLAILVSKLAHALGVRLQLKLETQWGGLPTHAWLRPSDKTHSEQQKTAWREAVSQMSGLNVERAITETDAAELERVIADAILACRNRIRGQKKAALLQTFNIAFGFARNLAGMKWLSLILCLTCSTASVYGTFRLKFEPAGTLIQILFLIIAAVYAGLAHGYVRHCAIRYAEFFFNTVVEIAGPYEKRKH